MSPTIASIKAAVAARYGLGLDDLTSSCRRWDLSHPRQVAMALSSRLTKSSRRLIGRQFGGRHPTTVLYAERQIAIRMTTDIYLSANVKALLRELCL